MTRKKNCLWNKDFCMRMLWTFHYFGLLRLSSKGNATPKERKKKHHPDRPDRPDCPTIPTQSWSRMIQDDPGWSRIIFDADSAMLIRTFGCWFRWRWFDSIFFDPEIIRFKEKPRQWLPFYCIPFSKVFCLKWCQNTLRKPMWIREVLFPPWQVEFQTCIFENNIAKPCKKMQKTSKNTTWRCDGRTCC